MTTEAKAETTFKMKNGGAGYQPKATFAIQWSEKKVKVSELRPYENNPRSITREAFRRLKASIRMNGYHQRILTTPDLRVVGGHQRIKALQDFGIMEITVLMPDRELTQEEFDRILIQDNVGFGDWDMEKLSALHDVDTLVEWGIPEKLLIEPEANMSDDGEGGGSVAEKEKCEACGRFLAKGQADK